jgi:uncharacterized membrane protein YhaH (DUF805 family)
MTSETFEQILTAAEADGSFTPAWKKFVNTKFFVPVVPKTGPDAKGFTLLVASGQVIKISEVRERLEAPSGGVLASLSGADVVRLLQAEADILVALSDRVFNIAKDRVDWLKKGIEAAQARAAAKAGGASTLSAPAAAPAAAPARPAAPVAAAVPPPPVSIAKPEPAPAPPPVPRRQGGVLDIAALKPRPVTLEKIGLEFFVPGHWREVRNASGMQFTDDVSGTVVKASGSHRADTSLAKWQGMCLQLVQHEMRFLTQDGEPYAIDGDDWRDRVKGMATEFTGTFPGDDGPSRYLVACIRVDGIVASIAIRASAEAFEQNRALYKWLLGRVDINESAAAAASMPAPARNGARASSQSSQSSQHDELSEYPGAFGFSLAGRISRLQALAYSFPVWAPFFAVAILAAVVGPKKPGLAIGMFVLVGIVTAWLGLRLMVMRLHDANISGKWILGFIGIGVLAGIMRSPLLAALVFGGGWLASLVFYCLVPGTPDDNDYGPPPGENTMLVKIGATLFILLQLSALGGGGKMRNSPGLLGAMMTPSSGGSHASGGTETFMPDDASVMVDMPGTPDEVQIPMAMRAQSPGKMQMYQLSAEGRVYMVQIIDFGRASIDHAGAMDAMQQSIIGNDGALIESKMILMNGFKGRDVRVKLPGGVVRAARFVIVGAKIRSVIIVAGSDPASSAAIDSYLTSFRLPQ